MKKILRLFTLPLILSISTLHAKDLTTLRICYVSMNADTEQPFLSRFVGLFNDELAAKGYKGEVVELQSFGAKPIESIQKAIDAGVSCDGLVLSGHFCGEFHGCRMRGSYVTLSMIEKLSCQPQNVAWFSKIKALWNQGCRSLGVGNSSFCPAPQQQAEQNLPDSADGYADRALGHAENLVNEGFTNDFRNLYYGYSESVGSKNPPGDRYLRIFPSANIFGWTATSPGEGQSEVTIPHHFSQLILANDKVAADDKKNLFSAKSFYLNKSLAMDEKNKKLYADSFIEVLTGKEPQAVTKAWIAHARPRQPGPYNIDRWDFCPSATTSMAYLSQKGDAEQTLETFKIAKGLNCAMATAKNEADWHNILTSRDFNDATIPLVFPMLWESLNPPATRKNEKAVAKANISKDDLRSSKVLLSYLDARIKDPKVAAIPKFDWYFFLKNDLGVTNKEQAEIVIREGQAFIDLGLPTKLPGTATIALEGLHRDIKKQIAVLKQDQQ